MGSGNSKVQRVEVPGKNIFPRDSLKSVLTKVPESKIRSIVRVAVFAKRINSTEKKLLFLIASTRSCLGEYNIWDQGNIDWTMDSIPLQSRSGMKFPPDTSITHIVPLLNSDRVIAVASNFKWSEVFEIALDLKQDLRSAHTTRIIDLAVIYSSSSSSSSESTLPSSLVLQVFCTDNNNPEMKEWNYANFDKIKDMAKTHMRMPISYFLSSGATLWTVSKNTEDCEVSRLEKAEGNWVVAKRVVFLAERANLRPVLRENVLLIAVIAKDRVSHSVLLLSSQELSTLNRIDFTTHIYFTAINGALFAHDRIRTLYAYSFDGRQLARHESVEVNVANHLYGAAESDLLLMSDFVPAITFWRLRSNSMQKLCTVYGPRVTSCAHLDTLLLHRGRIAFSFAQPSEYDISVRRTELAVIVGEPTVMKPESKRH